jgi:hypothetical protein
LFSHVSPTHERSILRVSPGRERPGYASEGPSMALSESPRARF